MHMDNNLENKVVSELLVENRKTRRWGVFFKSFFATYLLISTMVFYRAYDFIADPPETGNKHIALVNVNGVILSGQPAGASRIISSLHRAVSDPYTAAVILNIDSPGGSAVQSDYIYKEVLRLRKLHSKIPFYAIVGDMAASGGYYIASSAEKIYVNPSSVIGSIGVISNGFGYSNVMRMLGVERRVQTAGEHKAFNDPYSPVNKKHTAHLQTILDSIHEEFANAVVNGRGDRLDLSKKDMLFSGLMWTGKKGIELGLADELGNIYTVSRELRLRHVVDFTKKAPMLTDIIKQLGASFATTAIDTITSANIK